MLKNIFLTRYCYLVVCFLLSLTINSSSVLINGLEENSEKKLNDEVVKKVISSQIISKDNLLKLTRQATTSSIIRNSPIEQSKFLYHGKDDGSVGKCLDFLRINNLLKCSSTRDDDYYMFHKKSRCYCDKFCLDTSRDCCPDAKKICKYDLITKYYHGKYQEHGIKGGSCKEFLNLNGLRKLVKGRDPDAYIINFGSVCFCDEECGSECCYDYKNFIDIQPQPPSSTKPTIIQITTQTNKFHSRNYFHGDKYTGGTCKDFFQLNNLTTCCPSRNEECYMYHFGSKCYCDEFCSLYMLRKENPNDCCPDIKEKCPYQYNHGTREKNGKYGGTCREFFQLNSINKYCPGKNNDCYMINYHSKCYCDEHCTTDCCHDHIRFRPTTSRPTIHQPTQNTTYLHGDQYNNQHGGTCREFFQLNNLKSCCDRRNDECYMLHKHTRCYCDNFCSDSKSRHYNPNDCCPDAKNVCQPEKTLDNNIKQNHIDNKNNNNNRLDCYANGKLISNGKSYKDNCKNCECKNGHLKCESYVCLTDLKLLNEINSDKNSLWKAANYSEFWSKTLAHGYAKKLGTQFESNNNQESLKRSNDDPDYLDENLLPENYDFRKEVLGKNPQAIFLIRDQGLCGASWAFSSIDVLNDRMRKLNASSNRYISVQMVISCALELKDGCNRNRVDVAWTFLKNKSQNLANEKCYPYENAKHSKALKCKNNECSKMKLNIGPSFIVSNESEKTIMSQILKNGPVLMIFKVYNDFFMYKSGIYTKHSKSKQYYANKVSYHSVKVFGWGTENGIKYWWAANSWGKNWGEDGYFRIRRNDVDTEIGKHVYAVHVEL